VILIGFLKIIFVQILFLMDPRFGFFFGIFFNKTQCIFDLHSNVVCDFTIIFKIDLSKIRSAYFVSKLILDLILAWNFFFF
jgi:hypothetical protein